MDQQIEDLQNRVAYIERQMGDSYRDERFRRKVSRIFGERHTVETAEDDTMWGGRVDVHGIDAEELKKLISDVEDRDLHWWTSENDDGEIVMTVTEHDR